MHIIYLEKEFPWYLKTIIHKNLHLLIHCPKIDGKGKLYIMYVEELYLQQLRIYVYISHLDYTHTIQYLFSKRFNLITLPSIGNKSISPILIWYF